MSSEATLPRPVRGVTGGSTVPPSTRARWMGLGSVFGKGFRDSRRVVIAAGIGLGLLSLFSAAQLATTFDTAASRALLASQMAGLPPVFKGLLGEPVDLSTLGGFLSWRLLPFYALVLGAWSIGALSNTLAGEARRGSLELLVASPISRRRIATEKALAHLAGMTLAVLIAAALTWLGTVVSQKMPADAADPLAVLGEFAWIEAVAVAAGAAAFATAPFVGRTRAAGIGTLVLLGGYVINGYSSLVPLLDLLRPLSLHAWTAGQRPMAGVWDPLPVVLVALLAVALLVLGVLGFERQDLGAAERGRDTGRAGRLPQLGAGIGGPASRAFADRAPLALAWGIGMGLYGAFIALSADSLSTQLADPNGVGALIRRLYPGIDVGSAGGILQLAFFGFGALMAGLAAATLVAGWVSDERDLRLELILAAPLGRAAWTRASGLATLAAVALFAVAMAAGVGIASLAVGDSAQWPIGGCLVLGLYTAALTGIGLAIGGVRGPRFAAIGVAVIAVAFYLLDTIGGALGLPDSIRDLSLTRHLGQPMVGTLDWLGMGVCLVVAVGGLASAEWGISRRDLER